MHRRRRRGLLLKYQDRRESSSHRGNDTHYKRHSQSESHSQAKANCDAQNLPFQKSSQQAESSTAKVSNELPDNLKSQGHTYNGVSDKDLIQKTPGNVKAANCKLPQSEQQKGSVKICTINSNCIVPKRNDNFFSKRFNRITGQHQNHVKTGTLRNTFTNPPVQSTYHKQMPNSNYFSNRKNYHENGNIWGKFRDKHRKKELLIVIEIDVSKNFTDQCEQIISQINITKEKLELVEIVRSHVETAFRRGIDDVEAVIFGSTVAGTAFRVSDVDVYLKSSKRLVPFKVCEVAPHVHNMIRSQLFYKMEKILGARVPIVRAINRETDIPVDVSFTSPHGITNSTLIKHLCSVDPRVRQLIMIVLLWAKKHCFVSNRFVSAFCLIILVIFYLQVVGVIPPLEKFLKFGNSSYWPSQVIEDRELLKTSNTEDLFSLLVGFFSFYSEIHFSQIVISPFCGQLLLPVYFRESKKDQSANLPTCLSNYCQLIKSGHETPLQISEMTVQEPTVLNVNMTKHLSSSDVEIFKNACQTAYEVMNKVEPAFCLSVIMSECCTFVDKASSASWNLACPETVLRRDWHQKIYQASRLVFSKILMMNMGSPAIDERYRVMLKNLPNDEPLLLYTINTTVDIYTAKRDKLLGAVASDTEIKREEIASTMLHTRILSQAIQHNFSFGAVVCVTSNFMNRSVDIKLIRQGKTKSAGHFTHVISYLMGGNFKKYMALALEHGT